MLLIRLWRRVQASLRRRGALATVWLALRKTPGAIAAWFDPLFDRRYGTDTRHRVELADLVVVGPNKDRGIRYEPTRAGPLRRLLRRLRLPCGGTFVDFGCGKGRVLIIAAEEGFERLLGIDFSEGLCDAADANLKRAALGIEYRIVHADAADAAIEEDQSVFYFYNPFDAVVLGRVLANIEASYRRAPRPMWLIYHNPVWRKTIDNAELFAPASRHVLSGAEFLVYRTPEAR